MADLTERQIHILKAIVEEYIDTAEAVASETLDKKYNLGVSPATIRNEMVRLTTAGYLKQPHTSAGRVPTPVALRYFVEKLMNPKELSVADEVKVKQRIWDYRSQMDKLLREATKTLANQTKTMSIAATDQGDLYSSGMGNILEIPEFFDIDITRSLLDTLDEYDFWWNIFMRHPSTGESMEILFGDDLGRQLLNTCGGVFIHFTSPTHQGVIGVLGPCRLNYPRIVPMVRYMGSLIGDMARSW